MNEELYHFGVKGMKWGVRKSEKTQAKIDRFKSKIRNTSDKNFILRNTINDRRRGRIQALKWKKENRLAKENYLANKTERNKKRVAESRKNRFKYNVAGSFITPAGPLGRNVSRGMYNRKRSKGDSRVKAGAKTYLSALGTTAALTAATTITTAVVGKKVISKLTADNEALIRQQLSALDAFRPN